MTIVVTVAAAFVLFTDTHSRRYRVIGGGVHALAHEVDFVEVGLVKSAES